ncbi:type I toxin-antitoxin system Hok family toxin [Escherichia coli]|nr:type I toxin-antitoxin system Hok family toxin [Escherichia coli]
MDGSPFFAWRQYKHADENALAAVIVLCLTVLGFTLLVGDSLCEFTVKERNIEFKVVLAYEPKK